MLSTSQILILLAALSAAVIISILFFRYTRNKEKFTRRPGYMLFLSSILFIIFIGIELTYFKYLSLFFFDFGWNSVLLTGTVFTVVTLPVLGFIPVRTIKAFFEFSPKAAVTEPSVVIQPMKHEIKAEEMLTVQEDAIIEEILTEQIVPAEVEITPQKTEDIKTEIPVQDKIETVADTITEIPQPAAIEKPGEEKPITREQYKAEEIKPTNAKKHPVKRTARPKTAPKSGVKKNVVHKTKKKSP